jgi:AcrR family transcriptional regulator
MWAVSTLGYPEAVNATSYHHGNLREALVAMGFEMAQQAGPDGVALREVARRVGVSHNAAYRHFADREALLGEISDLAMDRLTAAMQAQIDGVAPDLDPVANATSRLRAVGRAYVEFGLAEPGLFRVAFTARGDGAEELPDGPPTDGGPYGLLNSVLDDLVAVGYLAPAERPGSEVACWAAVHGFTELSLDGPLRLAPPDLREAALDRLLETIERGLATF